jgi:Protein of unknown function (DUF669)
MANLGTTFDPNQTEPARNGFDPLPDGEYIAQIVENEVRHTKLGTGFVLTWEIVDGEFANRKVWQNINYQNESEKAQAIGQGQLKNICDAIGYAEHLEDADVLMFQPCRVRIGRSRKQEGYEQRDEIKAVKPLAAQAPATKQQTTAPATKPATVPGNKPAAAPGRTAAGPAGAGTRPWNRTAA